MKDRCAVGVKNTHRFRSVTDKDVHLTSHTGWNYRRHTHSHSHFHITAHKQTRAQLGQLTREYEGCQNEFTQTHTRAGFLQFLHRANFDVKPRVVTHKHAI